MTAPTTPDVDALADRLAGAAARRETIRNLTADEPGLDVAAAYQVQRNLIDRRLVQGERLIGYKLGLVSRAKQEAMGVAEPLWGLLTDGMLHAEETPLDCRTLIHPRVEPEIAFLIGRDLDADATPASVLAATEHVFPALEVLDSRYDNFRFTLADVVADNASAALIVLGGRRVGADTVDLEHEAMVLRRDGEVVDTATGAAVLGHPAAAVAWLARAAGGLPAHSIVLSGGLTAPVALEPGTVVSAEFPHLGDVTLRCAR